MLHGHSLLKNMILDEEWLNVSVLLHLYFSFLLFAECLSAGTLNWIVSFSLTYFRKFCKAAVDPLSFLSTQLCVPIKPGARGEAALLPSPRWYAPLFFTSVTHTMGKESGIKQKNGESPESSASTRGSECEVKEFTQSGERKLCLTLANLLLSDLQQDPSLHHCQSSAYCVPPGTGAMTGVISLLMSSDCFSSLLFSSLSFSSPSFSSRLILSPLLFLNFFNKTTSLITQ